MEKVSAWRSLWIQKFRVLKKRISLLMLPGAGERYRSGSQKA